MKVGDGGLEGKREAGAQEGERLSADEVMSRCGGVEVVAAGSGRLRRMKTGQPGKGKTLPHVHRWLLGKTEH